MSLEDSPVDIIVIAPAKGEYISKFKEVFGPFPFNIYGDPTLTLYKQLGNNHFSLFKSAKFVISGLFQKKFKVTDVISKDKRKREILFRAMKTQDTNIQGSTWIFGTDNEVVWKHIDASPEDHANIEEIKAVLNRP